MDYQAFCGKFILGKTSIMAPRLDHAKRNRRVVSSFWEGSPFSRLPKPRYREDPATEKQITYLQLLLAKNKLPALDKIDALKLTRSEASRQINDLKEIQK